ncbi:MAG: FHA domain-containing protein [Eggerthellaceae bacterium]
MNRCPVCNNPLMPEDEACTACGYRLQESTEEFTVVSLEPENSDIPTAPSLTPKLTVLYGKQEGLVYQLEGDSARVGRSPQCEVFLNDMTVSREHALLERVKDGWSIQDTGSFNGVWVNNTNIDHVMLADRDVIQIGSFVLRYTE